MSDATAVPVPRKAFAVVATGIISTTGKIIQLREGDKEFVVPIYVHDIEAKCERRRNSLNSLAKRIKFADAPNMFIPGLVIYGVVPIYLPAKKAGKKMSDADKAAQVAKMQAGRKKVVHTGPAPK